MSILAQDFPFNSINKQMFIRDIDTQQLVDGKLYLQGLLPGDVIIINNNNQVVDIPQYEVYHLDVCVGVELDFTNQNDLTDWKIRFFNIKEVTTTINMDNTNLQQLIKLSLIFN